MTNRTKPTDMALNRKVKGRVGKDEICDLAFHEDGEAAPLERIATQHPVASELPEIADPADRSLLQGRKLIRRIGCLSLVAQAFDPKIDLAHIKTGCLKIEAEIE